MDAKHYRLDQMPQDQPIPKLDRRLIKGEKMLVAQVFLHKGFHLPTHHHEAEQFSCVLSGALHFRVGPEGDQEEVIVKAGEVLHLPSNVPHGADAHEDVLLFDLLSPVMPMGVDTLRDAAVGEA